MAWIKTINVENATGKLKQIYRRIAGPKGKIDHILMSHSLRPHTLDGHMRLYKNVLHHNANQIDKSMLEALGVYVSMLNQCHYCVEHHYQGFKRLINDDVLAEKTLSSMENSTLDDVYNQQQITLFNYAKKLTLEPQKMCKNDVRLMKEAGYDDGEILEVNQVIAYFNYANRTVLGLGVELESDNVGLSPNDNDDEENWGHS
ncbi:MAG: alkylhydroperoxidase [Gammaproteobacteria bacterium]|nr:MAG: alkylhydroperoxidase [Gammaproteobacteria bacterium]